MDGKELGSWRAMRRSFFRFGAVVLTGLLEALFLSVLFLALIIPGIIYAVYHAFSSSVVALRDLSGMDALNYSKSVISGHWWKVLFTLFLPGIEQALLSYTISLPFDWVRNGPATAVITSLVHDFAQTLLSAFFIMATAVFFLIMDYLGHYQGDFENH